MGNFILNLISTASPFIYLMTFTYSVNLGLIFLGLIGAEYFTEVALFLGITNLICSILGGSVRHNIKYLKITKSTKMTFLFTRIAVGSLFLFSLVMLKINFITIIFMARKINEWIIDIHISERKNQGYDFFLLCVDLTFFISGAFIFLNLDNTLAFLPWSLSPLIVLFIENKFNFLILNIRHLKETFSFIGYDGFAAIPVVLFRHLVDQTTTELLETILLITLISGSITGFMVKIIIPLSKNLYLKNLTLYLNKYNIHINIITFCFTVFSFGFISPLKYLIPLSIFFIAIAIYLRQVLLVNMISVKKIFLLELKLNIIILLIYILLINYNSQYIGFFFLINAIINFYFYKSKCLKYLQ